MIKTANSMTSLVGTYGYGREKIQTTHDPCDPEWGRVNGWYQFG